MSGPLFTSPFTKEITHVNVWKKSNDSLPFYIDIFGDDDDSLVSILDSTQYRVHPLGTDVLFQRYFRYRLRTSADSIAIQGLDFWIKQRENQLLKY